MVPSTSKSLRKTPDVLSLAFLSVYISVGILTSQCHLCFEEGHSNTPVHKLGNPCPVNNYHAMFVLSSYSYTQKELAHEQLQRS